MKKLFRKNQIIITTLAFLIAIAGYVSYDRLNGKKEPSAKEANAKIAQEDYIVDNTTYDIFDEPGATETMGEIAEEITGELTQEVSTETSGETTENTTEATANTNEQSEEILNPGETILTSASITSADYAATVKLNREQVRSKNEEALLEIINNENITEEQKQIALDEMVQMTELAQKEADAQMLLEAKGFQNVVVSISEDSCDVVLDMGDVTDAKRAQVEDIVKRKTGVEADKIIITPIHADTPAE